MNSIAARVLLVLAAVGWGTATTGTEYALDGFGPLTMLAVKLASATLVLWVVLFIRGRPRVEKRGRIALLGLFEPTLAYGGLTLGLAYTTATNGALLGASEACFVVVLAAIFLKEKIKPRSLVGLLLAVVGVLVIERVFSSDVDLNVGDLVVLGGNLAAAIYVILAAKVAPTVDSLSMTAYQFLYATIMSLPLAMIMWLVRREEVPLHVAPRFWVVAIMIGGLGFAGSFLLYNHAIRYVPAGLAGVTLNLVPIFGVITAIMFLNEELTRWHLIGGLLVLAGIMLFPAEKSEVVEEEPAPEKADART